MIPTHVFERPWWRSRVLILHFIYFILIYNIRRIFLSQLRIACSVLRFLKENRAKVSSLNWDINTNQSQGFANTSALKCFPFKSINCLVSTRLSQTFLRNSRAHVRCLWDASIDLHRYLTLLTVNSNFYRFNKFSTFCRPVSLPNTLWTFPRMWTFSQNANIFRNKCEFFSSMWFFPSNEVLLKTLFIPLHKKFAAKIKVHTWKPHMIH